MTPATRDDLPTYRDLIYPTLVAVQTLGGSAQAREITAQVLADIGATEEQLELTYDANEKSVLVDRVNWARSYAALGGLLDRPRRGLYLVSDLGKEVLALPAAERDQRIVAIDRDFRASRVRHKRTSSPASPADAEEPPAEVDDNDNDHWKDVLLARLHRLTPDGFEEFVIYLLKSLGMELTRVGGTGDEGIDGIGNAPIGPVLFSRVAVQAKRYNPSKAVGREAVALFQRDASTAGAERAVLVTLGRFTAAASKAANAASPTVNLIDGDRLCDLVRDQEIGLRSTPVVDERWFDRFASVPENEADSIADDET